MTWGTLEEEVMECFQRPQWQCGAAKVVASRVRESWIPRRKKHNCSSTTWEGSMEQAPSKHPRGPGEPFMCGSPPSFAPRGRGHILITKRGPNSIPKYLCTFWSCKFQKKRKKRGAPTGSHVSSMSGKRIAACAACCTRRCWVTAAARFSTRWRTCWRGGEGSNQEAFFFGIDKTKRYIDTLGIHSWEPPGTSRYAQHQR